MTVESEVAISGPYEGDDANTTFVYEFKILREEDLLVTIEDGVGTETVLQLGIDYSVTGVGAATGDITYPLSGDPLPAGTYLAITRNMEFVQGTDFDNQGGYYPETTESAFDRVEMKLQQLREMLNRALIVGPADPADPQAYMDLLQSILAIEELDVYTKTQINALLALQDELAELGDVVITTPADGQVLTYDTGTGKWVNEAAASAVAWGAITGTLSDQTDLQSALDGKSATGHTHVKANITDFSDGDYATAAQGTLAASAVQPGDNVSALVNDAGYLVNVVEDTTPQLGGDLDLNGNDITDATELNLLLNSLPVASWYPAGGAQTEADATFDVTYMPNGIVKASRGYFTAPNVFPLWGIRNEVGAAAGALTVLYLQSFVGDLTGNVADLIIRLDADTDDVIFNRSGGAFAWGKAKTIALSQMALDSTGRLIVGDCASDALGAEAGSVTISTGDAGAFTLGTSVDDLIVEGSDNTGITIACPATKVGQLRFDAPGHPGGSQLKYDWATGEFRIVCDAADRFSINSTGVSVFGDLDNVDALGAEAGSVTISTGDSGVSAPSSNADELILEGSGNTGLTIASPNTALCQIRFADPESSNAGAFKFDHVYNSMLFDVNGGTALTIESDGTLSVVDTANYETLVTSDDDIPNRKFVADFAMPGVYTASGSDDITATVATISFDTEVLDPASNYSVTAGAITVAAAGFYEISYSVMFAIDDDTGDTRSEGECWVERDSGSGFAAIAQSYGSTYIRETTGGTSVNSTFICQLTAGDEIKLQAIQTYATVNASTVAGRPQISIKRIG